MSMLADLVFDWISSSTALLFTFISISSLWYIITGVEFRHSTPNISKVGWKIGNGIFYHYVPSAYEGREDWYWVREN